MTFTCHNTGIIEMLNNHVHTYYEMFLSSFIQFMEKSSAPVSAVHSQAGSMGQSVPGRSVSETSSVNQLTLNTPPPSQSSSGARPKRKFLFLYTIVIET